MAMGDTAWFRPSLLLSILMMSAFAFGASGCGGSDDESPSGGEGTVTTAESSSDSANLDEVLTCLQSEGIDAKDQSSSLGETIGIDYSGGRTTISFEDSEEDAELSASLGETYGEVTQFGTIVVIIDPSADTADTAVVESCVEN
jgi:hypothetical protein